MELRSMDCNIFTARNEVAKVMFLPVSVCPRGGCYPSMPCNRSPGGACLLGGVCSQGVPALGGGVCSGGWRPPPPRKQTATVADGTHPTGMYSCM